MNDHDLPPVPLTQRQRDAYEFIKDYLNRNGIAPSVRELAEQMGVQINSAAGYIKALLNKGYLTATPGKARSLSLGSYERDGKPMRSLRIVRASRGFIKIEAPRTSVTAREALSFARELARVAESFLEE